MSTCHNSLEKSSALKIIEDAESGYSLFTNCSVDTTEIKLRCYRGKHFMERFCTDWKEHETKIMNYKKQNDTINK